MVIWVCSSMSTLHSTQTLSTSRRQPTPSHPLGELVWVPWVPLQPPPQLTASKGFSRVRATSVLNTRAQSTDTTVALMISLHPRQSRWLPLRLMDSCMSHKGRQGIRHRLSRYLSYADFIRGYSYSPLRYRIRLAILDQLWLLMVLNLSRKGNQWRRR